MIGPFMVLGGLACLIATGVCEPPGNRRPGYIVGVLAVILGVLLW